MMAIRCGDLAVPARWAVSMRAACGAPFTGIAMKKKSVAAAKASEGSLTEALGKLTGDTVIEARGAARKKEAEAEHAAARTGQRAAKKKPG